MACNTATTNAIESLRKTYQIPFVGIEPAIKPAALQTKTGVVGVLATKGTLSSGLFHETSTAYGQGVRILEKEGKHLVEMIESGMLESDEMEQLLQSYTKPMIEQGADHLVLGCTHYPFLTPILNRTLPKHIKIVDCNGAVAKQVERVLNKKDLGCMTQIWGIPHTSAQGIPKPWFNLFLLKMSMNFLFRKPTRIHSIVVGYSFDFTF